MKKVLSIVIAAVIVISFAVVAADAKVVGTVKEIILKIADEKSGKVQEVVCGDDCTIKKRTNLKVGAKVTVEKKAKKLVIRKAVAGC